MKKQILTILLVGLCFPIFAQMYVNKMWENDFGTPDTVAWSASMIDGQGNMTVVGNTTGAQGNADILVNYYDREGNLIWQDIYNHTVNGNDYGVAVATDYAGGIYIAGAVADGNGGLDWLVRKYDTNGNEIWTTFYNHVGYDVPTAMAVSLTGEVYVTGIMTNLSTQADYLTIKHDASGNQEWAQSYDYQQLGDIPVAITLDNSGNVIVTGGSQSASNSADYCTLQYDNSGNLLNTDRQSVAGTGMDKPMAMARDNAGNIVLTGVVQNGSNTDIRTLKFDSNFAFQWAQTYDRAGLEDVAKSIAADAYGNVFITGYSTDSIGNRQLVIIKYDASGNQIWVRNWQHKTKTASFPTEAAEIIADVQGNIYIAGNIYNGSNTVVIMLGYDTNGNKKWEKQEDGSGIEHSEGLHILGSRIYTLRTKDVMGQKEYKALQFEGFRRTRTVVLDAQNNPSHLQNELIVRFSPTAMIPDLFLNREKIHGKLQDFVQPAVITLMENKLNMSGLLSTARAVKEYPYMTIGDSISYSRLSQSIRLADYWATLIIMLPSDPGLTTQTTLTEQEAADSLSKLKPYIYYATPNHIMSLDVSALDDYYGLQSSLYTTDPLIPGHINVETAWDYSIGNPDIRVGVYDSGISWGHKDFSINGDQSWDNSVVAFGYDYVNQTNIDLINYHNNDTDGHGTNVAGIIGACRNNIDDLTGDYIGVAGIAGGDYQLYTPPTTQSSWTGVFLDMMRVTHSIAPGTGGYSDVAAAIFQGTIGGFPVPTGIGLGQDIMNHSWGGPTYNPLLRDAIVEAYKHNVVFCASRGNNNLDDTHFPASHNQHHDEWLIAVGGTQEDMSKHPDCSFGDLDVCGPASLDMILTTGKDDDWVGFRRTSAATPHVAGTAALMLSYFNTPTHKLIPEDVEFLLERYAKFNAAIPPYVVPNDNIGWGLIDAGITMEHLDNNFYDVLHIPTTVSFGDMVYFGTNTMTLEQDYTSGGTTIPAGTHSVDLLYFSKSVDATPFIPAGWGVINSWGASSLSEFYPDFTGINYGNSIYPRETDITFTPDPLDIRKGTISGFAYQFPNNGYFIIPNGNGTGVIDFSVHIELGVVNGISEVETQAIWHLYPNPTAETFSLTSIYSPEEVSILSIEGKILKTYTEPQIQQNANTFDISELSEGIYICEIQYKGHKYYQKIIKQ